MPAGTKPLSALGPTFTKMGEAAQRGIVSGVEAGTNVLHRYVTVNGAAYHIRGRRGDKVRLTAKKNVRGFKSSQGAVVRGAVFGIPEGFWAIVEHGSGDHIIVSRQLRNARTTKSGKVRTSIGARTVSRRIEQGKSFADVRPVRTPYGPRQFVHHPGHRPIGSPWERSMRQSAQPVADAIAADEAKQLIKAFI
jgi:hypothetical protein